jgi:pilus assembly protein CpaB
MARRTVAVLIAIVLALAAAGLVWWYASSVRQEAEKEEGNVAVLIASEDIPQRTTGEAAVEQNLVEMAEVPERLVAPGALTTEAALQGGVFTAAVAKGQQIVSSQLGAQEEASLSFRIKSGMRAISVPIDRVRGVGGLLTSGDKVDVIATFKAEDLSQALAGFNAALTAEEVARLQEEGFEPENASGTVTRILLQQIEVLAVDQLASASTGGLGLGSSDENAPPSDPVVILTVTPEDAERLVLAEEIGSVWFILVPGEDTETVPTPGSAVINVFPR